MNDLSSVSPESRNQELIKSFSQNQSMSVKSRLSMKKLKMADNSDGDEREVDTHEELSMLNGEVSMLQDENDDLREENENILKEMDQVVFKFEAEVEKLQIQSHEYLCQVQKYGNLNTNT